MTSLSDGFQISKWFRKENLVSPTQISQSAHFIRPSQDIHPFPFGQVAPCEWQVPRPGLQGTSRNTTFQTQNTQHETRNTSLQLSESPRSFGGVFERFDHLGGVIFCCDFGSQSTTHLDNTSRTLKKSRPVCRTHFDRQSPMRKLWERSGFTKCQFNAFASPKSTTIWRLTDEQCCDSWLTRRISIVDLCLLLESRSFRQKARWKFGYIGRFNDTRLLFRIIWISEVMLMYFCIPFQNIRYFLDSYNEYMMS